MGAVAVARLEVVLARLAIQRNVRVGNRETNPLRQVLMNFTDAEIAGQPLPNKDRTDDRYELLAKFQGVLRSLRYNGIVVLVDRVDEPHLINGSAEQMRALLWPMLDNKFLKHPGLGFKLLLPIELSRFIEREERDFYQRARLDKQNMIPSLEWTGEALYDVANARSALAPTQRRRHVQDRRPHAPRPVRRIDLRAAADRRAPQPARAAAPVQVHVPAAGVALQRAHRRRPGVEDLRADVRIDARALPPRPGRLRPRRRCGVGS